MKNQKRIRLNWMCMGLVFLTYCVSAATPEKLGSQTNTVYQINKSKVYKIMVPKSGYFGSPWSPFAPSIIHRYPTNENHFKASYVRITVIADRKDKQKQRIVLRMDEVDAKMKLIHTGLYHAYIDFMQEGVKILCRSDDDNGDSTETNINYNIPFPFECARPPKFGFKKGNNDGHRDELGYCVKYSKSEKIDASPVVIIEATRCENFEGHGELGQRPPKWYASDIDDVVKSKETKILYRENQKWASESDWLWDEMERFDKDGNILMKCKKIQ
jgi:hypothetical protein